MDTTRCLREEHQVILRILDCFEVAIERAREADRASAEVFAPFVEFFVGYTDKCHHCKEEDRLFPQLERQGISREGGPIGCMLREHEQGRAHMRVIAEAIDPADRGDENAMQRIFYEGDRYIELLRNHIAKEDGALFQMADEVVQGASLAQLKAGYTEVESDPDYTATLTRCRAIAEKLIETYMPMQA
ncbi:hypothetical protein MNBD_PLANCTO03-1915 [hydrothermal vent metagenome]|uniref:Hemerythrin-like domain-containing protein n=1 Tax=hydrothermal vent metagenome TaxID=652676 RepID=A0A3B1DVT8_9ZZZZ